MLSRGAAAAVGDELVIAVRPLGRRRSGLSLILIADASGIDECWRCVRVCWGAVSGVFGLVRLQDCFGWVDRFLECIFEYIQFVLSFESFVIRGIFGGEGWLRRRVRGS